MSPVKQNTCYPLPCILCPGAQMDIHSIFSTPSKALADQYRPAFQLPRRFSRPKHTHYVMKNTDLDGIQCSWYLNNVSKGQSVRSPQNNTRLTVISVWLTSYRTRLPVASTGTPERGRMFLDNSHLSVPQLYKLSSP